MHTGQRCAVRVSYSPNKTKGQWRAHGRYLERDSAIGDNKAFNQTEAGAEPGKQIRRAYQLAFGRAPDSGEIHDAEPVVREHGLPTLCRVLFNSNEFMFLP